MNTLNEKNRRACARHGRYGVWAALWLATAGHTAEVLPMRDPMQAPAAAQVPLRTHDVGSQPVPVEVRPRHLMVVDGRRFLIDGGRRLAVGDLLGSARIERIDDGSVWLREAGVLRQVSLFGGISKRAVPGGEGASSPAASPPTLRPARPGKADLPASRELNAPNR